LLDPLEKVAEAVDYLHGGRDTGGQPVLHRDIKPANILLSDDGRVYLVDFGLVRFEGAATMSKVSGTVPFMAPESLHRGEYSPATDRYAVGATLYYALTGETPVPGDVDGMTRRLTDVLGSAQSRMVHGIVSMLSVSPSHRPQTATGWLHALRTPAEQTTLGASPPSSPPTPAPPPPHTAPPLPPPPPGAYGPPPPPPFPYGPPPFPGKPQRKGSGGKIVAIIGGVVALVLIACCGVLMIPSLKKGGTGLGGDPTPSISVDRKVPPPVVQVLQPIQVSVAQIAKVTGVDASYVSTAGNDTRSRLLMGGLNNFQPCAEGTVSGAAIGSQTSNGFYLNGTYIASSVAGFYGTAARAFFASAAQKAERCGWNTFEMSKLGQESVAYSRPGTDYSSDPNILVLVRSGQVIFELTMSTGHGSAQADATQLAAGMAKKMPAAK
jgi:hypothetical protein